MVLFKNSTVSEPQTVQVPKRTQKAKKRQERVDSAVYYFIKALRTLKRNKISSYNISVGLEIPQNEITQSIERLRTRGVRISKL